MAAYTVVGVGKACGSKDTGAKGGGGNLKIFLGENESPKPRPSGGFCGKICRPFAREVPWQKISPPASICHRGWYMAGRPLRAPSGVR